jgi:hypothetical protein
MEEKAHAKLGASTSEIWLNCAGAPNLWEKAPPQKESAYAHEGTAAHDLLEKWARHIRDKSGAFIFPKTSSPGMREAVRVCIDDLKTSWTPKAKKDLVIEKKVSLSEFVAPDMFGTVDLGVVQHFGTLEVTDYKHGSGVKVDIYKESASGSRLLNTQLVYYALGLAYEYHWNFRDVILKIVQPRFDKDAPIKSVRVTMDELYLYVDLFKRGVERTMRRDARRTAGPWCRFCKAKTICKEGQGGYRTDSRGDF